MEDLEVLAGQVRVLRELTNVACEARIIEIEHESELKREA